MQTTTSLNKKSTSPMLTITRTDQKERLIEEAVRQLIEKINTYRSEVSLGLCGGRIAQAFYARLVDAFHRIQNPQRLHFFLVDERLDPSQRNGAMILEVFAPVLRKGILTKGQFHFLQENTTLAKATDHLNTELYETVGAYQLDFAILSMGEDGHIASLFANEQNMFSEKAGYGSTTQSPKPPRERITLLSTTIQTADTAFLFVVGDQKQEAFENFMAQVTLTNNQSVESDRLQATFTPIQKEQVHQLPALLLHVVPAVAVFTSLPCTKQ